MKMNRVALILGAVIGASAASGDEISDIRSRCEKDHPGFWNYFDRDECITKGRRELREAEERLKAAEAKRLRQERARPCIADDLKRMEDLAWKAVSALNENMNLEMAQKAVEPVLGANGQVVVADDNIKEKVRAHRINTKCDSDFYLLINVRASEYGAVRWVAVWSQEPPTGYPSGRLEAFATDFEDRRWRKVQQEAKELAQKDKTRAKKRAAIRSIASKPDSRDDPIVNDHCGPGLSKNERLRRLASYGALRQTSEDTYTAGNHSVSFFLGQLLSCY